MSSTSMIGLSCFCASGGQIENGLGHEIVVQDDVGCFEQAQRLDRQQIGIAGARADKMYFAGQR